MANHMVTYGAFTLVALLLAEVSLAHPGRTDANGGHYDHQNGGYHYHTGQSDWNENGNGTRQSFGSSSSPVYRRAAPSKPKPHWRELYAPRYPSYRIEYKNPNGGKIENGDGSAAKQIDGGTSRNRTRKQSESELEYGRVVEVIDGDTIRVNLGYSKITTVRLYGIDCPELGQPFGVEAKEFTTKHSLNQIILFQAREKDKYGRLVGYVTLLEGLRGLNHELVRVGLAHWYQEYAPDERALEILEASARTEGCGIWSQSEPVFPWVFRAVK